MHKDDRVLITVLIIFFLGMSLLFAAVSIPTAWYNYNIQAEAMRNGYEQVLPSGRNNPIWVKSRP